MSLVSNEPSVDCLLESAYGAFRRQYSHTPTIGALAPGRVNLIGEHTDYTQGYVLPIAIQMYTLVVGRKTDTGRCRLLTMADRADEPKFVDFSANIADRKELLEIPSPKWANYVKGTLAFYKGSVPSFDAVVISSVPFGRGLSSSASLQVALYTFLDQLATNNRTCNQIEKVKACLEGEQVYAGLPCGIMDQYISFLGKKDTALFIDCRSLESTEVPLFHGDVCFLISDSNVEHELTSSDYTPRQRQCQVAENILHVSSLRDVTLDMLHENKNHLGEIIYHRVRHVITENARTKEACIALLQRDYAKVGKLMIESHISLRDDYEVSCPELDQLVDLALEVDGVYGSRLTGGGFGGCTISLVQPQSLHTVMKHIKEKYNGSVAFYVVTAVSGSGAIMIEDDNQSAVY